MSVIAIANHKGGVGKTTTTVNLGAGLANIGYRVLIIDMDPQANATFSLGLKKQDQTIYQVLMFQEKVSGSIQKLENLDMIPSSVHLAAFEKNNEIGKEFILTESLEEVRDQYDYILIDCPPSLGALTVSALTASDWCIITLQPEFLALQGMTEFIKILRTVKTRMNQDLDVLGIVITQFDQRKVLHREILEYAKNEYDQLVFESMIRGNVALAEAQSMGQDIFRYQPGSNGANDYGNLAMEFVKRVAEGVTVPS
jgi:chromosome partitioning protein